MKERKVIYDALTANELESTLNIYKEWDIVTIQPLKLQVFTSFVIVLEREIEQ